MPIPDGHVGACPCEPEDLSQEFFWGRDIKGENLLDDEVSLNLVYPAFLNVESGPPVVI